MSAPQTSLSTTILSVGNFDGVHIGHQSLVKRGRELASLDGRVLLLTFYPHPRTILYPDREPALQLTDFETRRQLLCQAGADEVLLLQPTPDLLSRSPQEFVELLIADYGMTTIVEGPDFNFGKGRSGTVADLRTLGSRLGFDVVIMDKVECSLEDQTIVPVSSTMIRWLIHHGRAKDASRLLGRPYRVCGEVVPGDQRGRTIGIPTANLMTDWFVPAAGVYAGRARRASCGTGDNEGRAPGVWYPAAINIGSRPTFDESENIVCEAHLIGYDGSVGEYGWTIEIEFIAFIRSEMRFGSSDEIARQIRRDIEVASEYVRHSSPEKCPIEQ